MSSEEKNIFNKGNIFQINFKNGLNSININKNDLNNILKISDIKNIDNFLHVNIDKNIIIEDSNIKDNNNYNINQLNQLNINGNNLIISSFNENNNENGSFNYNNNNNNYYNNNNDNNNYNNKDNNYYYNNNQENIISNNIKEIESKSDLNNSQNFFQYNKISNQSFLNDSNNNINNINLTNNNLNYTQPNLVKFSENKENSSILSEILELKKQGNENIKTNNPLKAIEFYDKAISKINEFLSKDENENDEENEINTEDLKSKINLQYKLILSNKSQSLFKLNKINESIEIDKFIIENLDNKFDKSYARLINNYIILDQIEIALKYKEQLKNLFNQEVILKYNDILENLDKKEKEKNENMMKFMKKSKKNENKKINEFENKQQISRRYKKLFNYMSMFFSGVLFVSSGYALYLLYSNRKKFI